LVRKDDSREIGKEGDCMERTKAASGHFAAVLKQARLKKRWKQEDLAEALHVKLRTVVSWETGTRLPSGGLVFLLCILLQEEQRSSDDLLQHELFLSYLIDDLHHQTEVHHNQGFHELVEQSVPFLAPRDPIVGQQTIPVRELLPSPIKKQGHEYTSTSSQESQEGIRLDHLFALIDHLRTFPNLISVVNDFLNEIEPPQSL
jgi:transcriptional regulator with XRE-family HTH domain